MPLKIANIIENENPADFRNKPSKSNINKLDGTEFLQFSGVPDLTSFHNYTRVRSWDHGKSVKKASEMNVRWA